MIVQIKDYAEFEAKRRDYSPRWVRLLDHDKNVIIPYNSKMPTLETHLGEIKKFILSADFPPGTYYIDSRRSRANEGILYTFVKTETDGSAPPPPPQIIKVETDVKKTVIVDDAKLLEIQVECARLTMENAALKNQIIDLEDEITAMEETENLALSDKPSGGGWMETLKEMLPVLGDPILEQWKRKNDIAQAELGYKYEMLKFQQSNNQAPPQYTEPKNEMPGLDELIAAKHNAPNEFYAWYAEPSNKEYYDNLLQNEG